MPRAHPSLSRKFAQGITEAFKLSRFRKALLHATPQNEQKATAPHIREYLKEFLKAELGESAPTRAEFDWEGKDRGRRKQKRSYWICGTRAWPDAAVRSPFRCAFEFDREGTSKADFETQLLKASVHVLSGAYQACVFVCILQPGRTRRGYVSERRRYTRKLIEMLRARGLYVALINNRSV